MFNHSIFDMISDWNLLYLTKKISHKILKIIALF